MTEFRVWAPAARQVDVQVAGWPHAMSPDLQSGSASGWWSATAAAESDARYAFRLDGGDWLADPRSPRQPDGPAGLSQCYDQAAFDWTDAGWRGVPLAGAVLYEMHVGTFASKGTFDAAIKRLDHLVALGVDTIELMPVAAFPGRHGWGYDGISLWAVHEPYGGPDGLKRFVDACHARRLAVVLDVVYNHVGIGNRLAEFGPYFTDAHSTPWGPAVNLDQAGSDQVRAFIVDNAVMWLRDYHLDGLRLDAVHALFDNRAVHLLEQLAADVRALSASLNRELVLIAESDANDPRLVTSRQAGGYGLTGQWNDDFHHALHAVLTGERQGYYQDFGSMAALAKTLRGVFFHDGSWSSFRGRSHGRPVEVALPADRFVCYLQDHDQVGNRAAGDRISATLPPRLLKVAAGLVLTAPFTPMLFMGEEWGAATPWQYFTDHSDPQLGQAVADGRRAEFGRHGWAAAEVPDPQDEATYSRSKLDWSQLDAEPHRDLLNWYRELITLRRRWPELTDPRLDRVDASCDVAARWLMISRGRLRVLANLGPSVARLPLGTSGARLLAASTADLAVEGDAALLPPSSFAVVRI
jgi:maltooligosyltrehalose trehalohydrolase